MTLPLTIHHAMVQLQKTRDLLEAAAAKCEDAGERKSLRDMSDDMTQLLCTLELTYGELMPPYAAL